MFTKRGWEIERETMANELLARIRASAVEGGPPFDPEQLKDRNCGTILLLLDKIEATGDPAFILFLEAWKKIRAGTRIGELDVERIAVARLDGT